MCVVMCTLELKRTHIVYEELLQLRPSYLASYIARPTGVPRVSLVVEQYKIKPRHMKLVEPITTSMWLGPDIPLFDP